MGSGPVQINIPIEEHLDDFTVMELPMQRKIDRYDLSVSEDFWKKVADRLSNSRIIIVCGEGNPLKEAEQNALDAFCQKFDCVILSDKISNCHHKYAVENAFPTLQAMSHGDVAETVPDIIISIRTNYSFNPEFKSFIKRCASTKIENWYVSASGKVVDPFHCLTNVFEMNEFVFFSKASQAKEEGCADHSYGELWTIISSSIEEPIVPYGHVYTIGEFLNNIPDNSVLHLSNSNSVRVAQFYSIDSSIEVHCNRGTDGIDGCMSTMVGYASDTDKPVFLMIGDLTFFYDMNALWNRQLGKNVRILLSNNDGGAIMHMPNRPELATSLLPNYISAQHHTSAKAWVEDRGFTYLSAYNEDEVKEGVKRLTDLSVEGPIILEVFTNMLEDTKIIKGYYATIKRATLEDKLKNKAIVIKRKIFEVLGIKGL